MSHSPPSSPAAPPSLPGAAAPPVTPWSRWLDPQDPARATLILIAATALIRVGLGLLLDFGIGEAYYVAGTRTPHLSYFDQPPLSLWMAWGMLALTGSDDPAVIRLPFIALFAGTTWLMFTLTRRLYSARAGYLAALFLNVSAVFTISVGGWVQPDGPLMLFWMLAAWALARLMLDPDRPPPGGATLWWLGIGVVVGLALLSKYHAVFLIAGAALFALTRADQRRWIVHPGPWLALLVAALASAPVLIWNAQHDWVSFAFQGGRSVAGLGDLEPERLVRSIVGQMVWLLPWVWLPMVALFARTLVRGPRHGADWFLACLAFGPVAVFTLIALWAPIGYHFHWQAPGYLMLFPLLGRLAAGGLDRRPRLTRTWVGGAAVLTALVVAVLASHIATNWGGRFLGPDQTDPTLEALDWHPLRADLAAQGLQDRPKTFAATASWIEGGKADTALGGAMPVTVLSGDPRNLAFTVDLTQREGQDVLLFGSSRKLGDPAVHMAQSLRGDITEIGRYDLRRGGDVVLRDIRVFLGHDFTTRRRIDFDGTAPAGIFGSGWGAFGGGPGSRAIDGAQATLQIVVEPRVTYGDLMLQASSATGQQGLTLTWDGQRVGRLILPDDGSVARLEVRFEAPRRVGRHTATLALIPDREGVVVHRLALDPLAPR